MPEPSTFTYDPTTDIGLVRLLTNDKYEDTPIFYDEELTAFLLLEGSVRKAAAKSLETIAADEALVQKVIKLLSLSTNGPAVAKELRDNAAALRAQDVSGDSDGLIDIAEWDTGSPGSYEELIIKSAQRTL